MRDLDDDTLLRYHRHIVLPQIDYEGQEKLLAARVLLIGLGGLGSPVAMYLAAAGVGHLVLVDYDNVELSNLQRQIIHTTAAVGTSKVASAVETLRALNPEVCLIPVEGVLAGPELAAQVAAADVVVDATDNLTTRMAINAACVGQGKPLVSGAAIRLEGQVMVYRPGTGGPCYRCLFRSEEELQESCVETGVIGPLLGVIGSIQALEVLKLLVGFGEPLAGKVLLLDALTMEWQTIALPKNPRCPVCSR